MVSIYIYTVFSAPSRAQIKMITVVLDLKFVYIRSCACRFDNYKTKI